MPKQPTHTVSIRVQVCGPEEFSEVYQSFCLVANGLGLKYNDVTVSSYLMEEWEEDSSNIEEREAKVSTLLRERDFSENDINEVIRVLRKSNTTAREA
jgi:hypothetical protein